MGEKFERIIMFEPAFDKRHPDPKRDCGIGDVHIRFVLKGEKGAVQFLFSTGWYLLHVRREMTYPPGYYPRALDLGYHSPRRLSSYDAYFEDCPILGGKCYYNGSFLAADLLMEKLVAEGDEAVWKELEKYYKETFGEE